MKRIVKIINKLTGKTPACSAVIVAAGSSSRMGGEDKLFAEICGAPVLAHALMAFQNCVLVNEIIIVARADKLEDVSELCGKYCVTKASKIIAGGLTRSESVLNGVTAVSRKARLVAIHDGARPCIDSAVISDTIMKAAKHHAAAPAVPVTPTLKKVRNKVIVNTVEREGLYEIQTPQVFDADIIKGALTKIIKEKTDITDDCMAVELLGIPVHITEGSPCNIKLTNSGDIVIAEAILRASVTAHGERL